LNAHLGSANQVNAAPLCVHIMAIGLDRRWPGFATRMILL